MDIDRILERPVWSARQRFHARHATGTGALQRFQPVSAIRRNRATKARQAAELSPLVAGGGHMVIMGADIIHRRQQPHRRTADAALQADGRAASPRPLIRDGSAEADTPAP
ncbi:MAG: hypothetical protein H6891_07775 [Brucellaceae bacterium]|nr:hypothetical protein [Brucellaceae bacterium]